MEHRGGQRDRDWLPVQFHGFGSFAGAVLPGCGGGLTQSGVHWIKRRTATLDLDGIALPWSGLFSLNLNASK